METSRDRVYSATMQSQMLQERRPMTIVSMAIKFNMALFELGKEKNPGQEIDSNLNLKQALLSEVLQEYDNQCRNHTYKLSFFQKEALMNCILHSSPGFLQGVQKLLDMIQEKSNPYKLKSLQTKRWIIGGTSGRANDPSIWGRVLVMDSFKQKILSEVINHEAERKPSIPMLYVYILNYNYQIIVS